MPELGPCGVSEQLPALIDRLSAAGPGRCVRRRYPNLFLTSDLTATTPAVIWPMIRKTIDWTTWKVLLRRLANA